MNKYTVKIEVVAEIEAFDSDDAKDYISDIFGTDDEIKSIKIINIKEK